MPTTLTTQAVERSTFAITASFTDETGAAVVPNSGLTWSLLKKVDGVETVVNSRNAVAITSAASVTIVLHGDDLALVAGEPKTRWVLVQGTYTSTLGIDLEIKEQVRFTIADLVGVT